ncbi:MAG TPA: biosynthetic-type acetolactate synthase large subunit [Candidatus Hydrogenedentes bacterium]|nr:biosynthetic-type acetolactate synthase large subunit [Candidatus Hydrogenedentota bacterium]
MARERRKKHPLAGKQMTGADMIIQILADEGVDVFFGYNGGQILPTFDALFRYNAAQGPKDQLNLVVPANEQGAGFMASGYARATGKVGVFVATSGPGATNCTTPIRDAMADSIPLVLITGQVPTHAVGTDAFQEAPVFSFMGACAKHVFMVSNPLELEATVRTAFDIARSGRPGPVVVDVPKDMQNYTGPFLGEGRLERRGYDNRIASLHEARLSSQETDAFFRLLGKSHRPLIYAGGGVISSNATKELRAFVERFRIPVVTTLMGIGAIDTTHELCLRMLGMHGTAYANYAVEDCDFLIAIGARFDDRVAGKVSEFAPHAKIAHVDIDAAEIGKVKQPDWAHVGDAKMALQDLIEAGKGFRRDFGPWLRHALKMKKDHPLNYNRANPLIQPEFVIETLNEMTRGNAIVCTGVGQHQMWAAQYFDFHRPRTFIASASMGTMGFGLPASIGAQLGSPGKTVIDVDGDGSLRMNIGELETATSYNVPVKVLLLNNTGDGMVLQWQRLFYGHRYSGTDKSLRKKDFVKVAEADGFTFARRVTEKEHVKKALDAWLGHDGPAFLDVTVDQNADVFPMVGPGQGYKEMITGPYIRSREVPHPEHIETADLNEL